jgi:hypothetical protein
LSSGPLPFNSALGSTKKVSSLFFYKTKEANQMTKNQQLLQQIANLESLVATQQEKYDIATKCLAQTQAAIAVSKSSSHVSNSPLTLKDFQEFNNALENSVQSVTDAIKGLTEMRRELQELKDALE